MILTSEQKQREAQGWCSAILVEPDCRRWCQQVLGHSSGHFNEVLLCSEWHASKLPDDARGEPSKIEEGIKHDIGKTRWDLLPFRGLEEVAKVLTFGAQKYAPDNWRSVQGWRWRYFRAAIGHLISWKRGEKLDPESNLPHLAHAICCALFMLELDT